MTTVFEADAGFEMTGEIEGSEASVTALNMGFLPSVEMKMGILVGIAYLMRLCR